MPHLTRGRRIVNPLSQRDYCKQLILIAGAAVLLLSARPASAAVFTVTNTNPSGAGSLAQAIADANAVVGSSTINFNISVSGIKIITGPLPTLVRPITIDGYSQAGTNMNGSETSDGATLTIRIADANLMIGNGGSGSVIQGLCITGGTNGIKISGADVGNCRIRGNFIGINPSGNSPLPPTAAGVLIASSSGGNIIGGTTFADRNVIGGCGTHGIVLGPSAGANTISGNFIGVEANGQGDLGNKQFGIYANSTSTTTIGGSTVQTRNVVSGNNAYGVVAQNAVITGNYIGTTAVGNAPLPNGVGASIYEEVTLGGTTAALRNVISGNTGNGVEVEGEGPLIIGNYIGIDAFGSSALPNGGDGIQCSSLGVNGPPKPGTFTVGGTSPGSANVISSNGGRGIRVRLGDNISIKGNLIGTDPTGKIARGNAKAGIELGPADSAEFAVNHVTIGGSESGAGNIIAFSGQQGVLISGFARANSVSGNSIFSNGALGIDLAVDHTAPDGVTPNDDGDADGGTDTGNTFQNFPILAYAESDGSTTTVPFTLNSSPSAKFTVEFFSSASIDSSGYGEGETFLGSVTNLTTDSSGNASFTASLPVVVPTGRAITATATSGDGATSEFSKAVPVNNSALVNISTRLNVQSGDNVLIGGFIIAGAEAKKVIIRAIGSSLNTNGTPITGRLADPTLELHALDGSLIGSNDNWKQTQVGGVITEDQVAEIESTGVAPTDDAESAIIAKLPPGNYTAIIRGAGETTGIGLVEVYDLRRGVFARLANISTRGFVDTGDNVMIGGFIVSVPFQQYVLRAIGPSLEGVSNALEDPTLQLFDGSGTIISDNDNWRSAQESAITASGVAPTNDFESAMIGALPAGNYTAIVRGKNGGTGVGLVEVYALQ